MSFVHFENGHVHNVLLTLPNVVKLDVENNNVVLTLPKVVHINVEIDNVDSTLYTPTFFQRWFDVFPRCNIMST